MKQVWHTIEQFYMLERGDRVLLGVSGGPDSMALLHLLNHCREQYGVQLFVVHVNHQLRPEAPTEAAYVQHICEQWQIPFRLFTVDVAAYAAQHGMSLEQAGHEVRYACFREAAGEWQSNKLALGHHRDDRAESLLLHLIQGCGLDGLAAMPPKDVWLSRDTNNNHDTNNNYNKQRCIIRPLAQVGKQELVQYCKKHQLQYFVDSTNLEAGCLRNQVRLELLPQLKQYNPQITDALLRLQDSCAADADYLAQAAEALWKEHGKIERDKVLFPADVLRQQHLAIQRRLLRLLYEKLTHTTADLTYRQMEQMLYIALKSDGSQRLDLSGNVVFQRQYNTLLMMRQHDTEAYHYSWNGDNVLCVPQYGCVLEYEEGQKLSRNMERCTDKNCLHILLDADKLTKPLTVRSRQAGDRLAMAYGHKKLKDFFIDKKIPAELRDRIPIAQSGDEIIWIPGYYAAACVKITDDTKHICRLTCRFFH